MNRQSGFTLPELMVTVVVVAILITVAVPGFRTMVQNNRITTQVNELVTSLNLARSEAIKRSTVVTVCASSSGANCVGNWDQGWIIFTDSDNNGVVTGGTDEILRVSPELAGGTAVVASAGGGGALSDIRYDRLGAANPAGSFAFTIPDCTGNQRRTVTVANSGRISAARSACP